MTVDDIRHEYFANVLDEYCRLESVDGLDPCAGETCLLRSSTGQSGAAAAVRAHGEGRDHYGRGRRQIGALSVALHESVAG